LEKIGPNAQQAVNAADFESTYSKARAKDIPVKQIDTPVLSIRAAAHGWLEDVKLSNRPETYELYEQRYAVSGIEPEWRTTPH